MHLDKVKAFVVVAEELNFRRSAEILGMSQPPLTRLITSLEDELSTKLFERTTRRVRLTSAGLFLLKEGRELIARAEGLEKEVRTIGKLKSGSISIGFSATAFLASLPKIIGEFQDRHSRIKMDLNQESRSGAIKGIKSGRFDLCFVEGPNSNNKFASFTLEDEALGVLLPSKHPLAKKKELELCDLENETIILHPRREHEAFYDYAAQLFKQNGIKPKTYVKSEIENCPVLVAIGKGVLLTIPGAKQVAPPGTQFIPIKKLFLSVSALWLAENENPVLKSFLGFVLESGSFKNQKVECLLDVIHL